MKSGIIFSVLLFLIISAGCSDQDQVTEPQELKNGRLKINYDKLLNIPDFEEVSLQLVREGYQTISKTAKKNEAGSISLIDREIEPGIWRAKFDIKFGMGTFSVNSDIQVLASLITIAGLSLENSTIIKVDYAWNTLMDFADAGINPLFTKYETINVPGLGVASSFILYEDNKFKMWYANMYLNRKYDINYAESNDGYNWQPRSGSAVISSGPEGAWDSYAVYPGAVMKEGSVYKMYYVGVTSINGDSYVGYATSTDGINWSKHPNPVIAFQYRRMAVNTVLKYADNYYLYYNYTDTRTGETGIGMTTSADGLAWTNVKDNILTISQPWETNYLISPCVRIENGIFVMYYGTLSNNAFGTAVSTDGINWKKSTNNPIFTQANTNWSDQVRYPYVIKVNDVYRLYYTGYKYGLLAIAFAEGIKL